MKCLASIAAAITILMTNPASGKMDSSKQTTATGTQHSIVTQNEAHHVRARYSPKLNAIKFLPKAKRQQQYLLANIATDDDSDDDYDDLDVQVGYRRPKLVQDNENDEVSPYVADRLAQARELALAKYREVWTKNI